MRVTLLNGIFLLLLYLFNKWYWRIVAACEGSLNNYRKEIEFCPSNDVGRSGEGYIFDWRFAVFGVWIIIPGCLGTGAKKMTLLIQEKPLCSS